MGLEQHILKTTEFRLIFEAVVLYKRPLYVFAFVVDTAFVTGMQHLEGGQNTKAR